ncbi:MAG: hypothetical protein AAFR31_17435 [Cyanobacteria bacterium J06627_8]
MINTNPDAEQRSNTSTVDSDIQLAAIAAELAAAALIRDDEVIEGDVTEPEPGDSLDDTTGESIGAEILYSLPSGDLPMLDGSARPLLSDADRFLLRGSDKEPIQYVAALPGGADAIEIEANVPQLRPISYAEAEFLVGQQLGESSFGNPETLSTVGEGYPSIHAEVGANGRINHDPLLGESIENRAQQVDREQRDALANQQLDADLRNFLNAAETDSFQGNQYHITRSDDGDLAIFRRGQQKPIFHSTPLGEVENNLSADDSQRLGEAVTLANQMIQENESSLLDDPRESVKDGAYER